MALLGSSLISVILFFRIFEIGYGFHESHGTHSHGEEKAIVKEASLSMLIPTFIVALGIVLIGLYNQPIMTHIIQFAVPELQP